MVTNAGTTQQDDVTKLAGLIKGIQFAMLTTREANGALRSRPMATQNTPFDGTLYFFTRLESGKVAEVRREEEVNLAYAQPDDQKYVSVSGKATVFQDRALAEKFWSPAYKAWFPKGLEDPSLAILKVEVTEAEYWDSPHGAVVRLAGFLKAIATGRPYSGGEHERVHLESTSGS